MKAYYVESGDIRKNLENLKKRAGDAPIWAVLKGNGYGLGLLPMAQLCRECGITRFCITEPNDAALLRRSGFASEQILMLRPTTDPDEVHMLLDLNVIATVSSQDDAALLNGIALQRGVVAEAHIKLDTGMGRYGFLPSDVDKLIPIYAYMDGIAISGIYTHLHSAFCSKKATRLQAAAFDGVLQAIKKAGYETGTPHICNSAGLLRFPDLAMGGVRIGSAILGRLSFKGSYGLKRVGVCEAPIGEIRWLPKGHTCGYGAAWKAKHPTRIAIVPVGWYHGFGCEMGHDVFRTRDQLRAALSALAGIFRRKAYYVMLGTQRCKVLGHIGMLHTVIDVTKVKCALGDRVQMNINPLMLKGVDVVFR